MGLLGAGQQARAGVTGPCKVATKGDSPIAKACTTGGAKEAKKTMDRMVKQAKAAGMNVECATCHNGLDDAKYDLLKKDARDQLTKMVAKIGTK